MLHHNNNVEHPTPKGWRLNRKLRTQLAVLIILLECTVVLAVVSHVITVPLPEPLYRMTIVRPPAPAPSAMQQKKSPETQRATDTATHTTKSEAFDPFAGIIEGIAQSMAVQGDFTAESNYDGDYHSQPLVFDLMLRDCNCQDCESPQRSVIDGGYGLNELNQNLNEYNGEVPVLLMQGTTTNGAMIPSASGKEPSINVVLSNDAVPARSHANVANDGTVDLTASWQQDGGQDSLHDPNLPVFIMQSASMVPDDSSTASPDDSEPNGPKVMSLKEFTERYGPVGD